MSYPLCSVRAGKGLKHVVGGEEEERGQVMGLAGTRWEHRKSNPISMYQIQNITVSI